MKIILAHSTHENCYIRFESYDNGRPAIIVCQDDSVLLKASVNLPEANIPESYVAIKDWSENSGILHSLILYNIISFPESSIPCSYVSAFLCKILIDHKPGTIYKGD